MGHPTFSPAALDGLECSVCARSFLLAEPVPSVPVATIDGNQVFACESCVVTSTTHETAEDVAAVEDKPRPFWQTKPCPAWCVETTHSDADPPSTREHWSKTRATPLTTMPPIEYSGHSWGAHDLCLSLDQGELDAEPRVTISESTDMVVLNLTLAEADKTLADLAELLRIARGERP